MSSSVSRGIWSNFTNRSKSLAIKNAKLQKAVLSPDLPNGPVSLKALSSKRKYYSPIDLDKIYPLAYEILEKESEKIYSKIEDLKKKGSENVEEINDLLVEAEINNPEVVYNSLYAANTIDLTQPVYRHYAKKQWESYNKMITMQRLETLSIIPDTLPTLEPEVDVHMKFPHNNVDTWVEPGSILSSNVTSKPPIFKITEFKESKNDLYTILIVNPDTPDVENNSYTTTLHWALKDVELSNNDSIIDIQKLDSNPQYSIVDYLPPTPEKNLGKQRFAVWIFRQDGKLNEKTSKIENINNFQIREFVENNKLQAVGAHAWRSVWDLNVENVRKEYGLPAGRIFSRDSF